MNEEHNGIKEQYDSIRFKSDLERKRIGILIQPDPGVFPQSYDLVRFSFVQTRMTMISQKEFVPAVSFIPLSSPYSTNEFSFLKNTSTQNGEFTVTSDSIDCAYANVILKCSTSCPIEWNLEVLTTIERIE